MNSQKKGKSKEISLLRRSVFGERGGGEEGIGLPGLSDQ